jgi:hypothetical protein
MHWASVPLTDQVVDPEVEESHRALERQRKEDYESHVKDAHADIDTFQRAIETAGDELRPRGARKLNRLLRKNALTMYVPPDGDDDEDGAGGVAMKRAEEMVDVQRDRGDRAAQYLKDNPDASMDVGMGTLNHLMEPFVSRSSTVFDGDEADGLVVARATFPELDRLQGPSPLPPSRSLPSVASSASPARVISAPPAPLPLLRPVPDLPEQRPAPPLPVAPVVAKTVASEPNKTPATAPPSDNPNTSPMDEWLVILVACLVTVIVLACVVTLAVIAAKPTPAPASVYPSSRESYEFH